MGVNFPNTFLFSFASLVYISAETIRDRRTQVCEDMNVELHMASNGIYTSCIEVSDVCDMVLDSGMAVNRVCPLTCDSCHSQPTQFPLTFAPSNQMIDRTEMLHPSFSPVTLAPHKMPSVAPSTSPTTQQLSNFQSTSSFFTSSEPLYGADRNVTFRGNYAIVIAGHEEEFFEECNEHSHPVYCTHVYPEHNPTSIIVTFRGDEEDLNSLVHNIVREGLVLDHFSTFTVTPEYAANVSLPTKQASFSDAEESDASVDVFLVVASAIGGVVFVATIAYCIHRVVQFQKNKEITENMKVQQNVNEGHPEIEKPENYDTDLEIARRPRVHDSIWSSGKTPGLTNKDDSNILSFIGHQVTRTDTGTYTGTYDTPVNFYAGSPSEGDKTTNHVGGLDTSPSITPGWVPSPEVQEPHKAGRGTAPYSVPQPNMSSSSEYIYAFEDCSEGPRHQTTTVNEKIMF